MGIFWRKREKDITVVGRFIAALNAGDERAMLDMLHPDPCFVDSHGYCLEGQDDVREAVRKFLRVASGFHIVAQGFSQHGGDVLVRGHSGADDPRLATDTLWKARVADGKMRYWQSFGQSDSLAIAHMLMPEAAKPSGVVGEPCN